MYALMRYQSFVCGTDVGMFAEVHVRLMPAKCLISEAYSDTSVTCHRWMKSKQDDDY
jgi:hypothetical protein